MSKTYTVEKNIDTYVDIEIDLDDVLGFISEMSLEDLQKVKEVVLENCSEFTWEEGINVNAPNLIAKMELEELLESFKKKWRI
jgi:hypothetical protein